MPRSNAARAASRCVCGAFVASRMRGQSADFYAMRRGLITPHAVNCGRLGRPIEHPLQGLARVGDPLVPLEDVGPSVYRCGMRHSSSSRALPIPHVPDRHAGGMHRMRDRNTVAMRRSGHRYTTGMRVAPSIPGLPSMTGTPPACADERAGRPSGEDRCEPDRRDSRRGTWRHPTSTRSGGASISAGNGLCIGAADTLGIASVHRFRPPADAARHRDRPHAGAATVGSGRPNGA